MNYLSNINIFYVFAEAECEIKKPLVYIETTEGETITLILEITKPRKVKWFKGKTEVTDSDRFKIEVCVASF